MPAGATLRLSGKVTGAQNQTQILAGVANKVIVIKRVIFSASAATTCRLQDTSSSPRSLTAIHELVAGINEPLNYNGSSITAAGQGITISTSAGNVAFDIEYELEP